MAVREILLYPKDKDALRERSEPVCTLNRQTRHLIKDLKDTLLAHPDGSGKPVRISMSQIVRHRKGMDRICSEANYGLAMENSA
jgi:hypothetical protein